MIQQGVKSNPNFSTFSSPVRILSSAQASAQNSVFRVFQGDESGVCAAWIKGVKQPVLAAAKWCFLPHEG